MAVYTVSNAGGNYNASATWVGGILPATTDTIEFTATSGNLTINVASTCAGVNFTNYIRTLTINTSFFINGNINLGTGGYLVGGGNTMYAAATGTITSNGTAWKGHFGFIGTSQTYTLADDLTVNGAITVIVTTSGTLNGFTIYVKSTYSHISTGNLIGTTNLVFNGTGTWSHTTSGYLGLNTTINTSGTITLGANVRYNTGILTYTAGTVVTTGSQLVSSTNTIFDTDGIIWNIVSFSASGTRTLLSNLTCNTLGVSGGVSTTNGFNIYFNNLSYNTTAGTISLGTTNYIFSGTGTWTHTTTGRFNNNLIIDCGAGTLTVTGQVYISNGSITYLSGTVNQTSGALTLAGSSIIKTSGMEWLFVYMNGSINTFNETFRAKTLSSNGFSVLTFAGTHGFEVENFFLNNALNITVTLVNGVRYLIKQSLITNIPGYTRLFTCASGAALLDLQYGATQNVANTSATRINSLGGQTIYTTSGTLTSTQNWNVGTYRNPTNFMIMF